MDVRKYLRFTWKRFLAVCAIASTIGGGWAAFSGVLGSTGRPAWTTDLISLGNEINSKLENSYKKLAGDLLEDRVRILENSYVTRQQQWYQNMREQRSYEQSNEVIPDALIREQHSLENSLKLIDSQLLETQKELDKFD